MEQQNVERESATASSNQVTVVDDLQILGKDIVARIEAGDTAKAKADDHYKAAGLQLIEAQKLVGKKFQAFLKDHCNRLRKSRAYELIKIAKGKTTTQEVRAKTNERTKRHRAKAAQAKKATETKATETKAVSAKILSATQRTQSEKALPSPSEQALEEFKFAVDTWLPKMDAAAKKKALAYIQAQVEGGRK
jgi:hypothetical protein